MRRVFTKKKLLILLTTAALLFVAQNTISYTNNPPLARTGAPGETNCTGCHSGTAITSGTDFNNLVISSNMKNDEYIPDSSYKITVSYTESGKSKFGFMSTTLKTSDDSKAGTYTVLSSTTTAKSTTKVNSKDREYMYHKSSGTSGSGAISWTFEWKAPAVNEGDVKFYVALNSTNNGSNSSGDKIILKDFLFEPSSKLPIAKISSATTVCVGDTLFLDGSKSSNSKSYTWTAAGATTSNKKDSVLRAVYQTAGNYTVKLTTANNIASSAEEKITIKVLDKPSAAVDILPNDSVCEGQTISMEAKDGAKWLWSNAKTDKKIEITQSGTYSLVVEGTNGCKSVSEDIELTVLPKPSLSININGSQKFCSSDSVRIEATEGLTEYNFYDRNLLIATSSNKDASLKLAPGSYSLTAQGKSKFGCVSEISNPLNITVEAQTGGPKINCENVLIESLNAQWLPVPGVSVFEVSIDSGKTWQNANFLAGNGHQVKNLSYGTNISFWVRGKVAEPCNYTTISTKQCKTKNCFKANYNLINDSSCINAEKGKIELNDIKIDKYAISFNKSAFDKNNVYEYSPSLFGVGSHSLEISIIDSNALSCPAYDTLISFQVNPSPSPEIFTTWQQFENENRICISSDEKMLEGNTSENGENYLNAIWKGEGIKTLDGLNFTFSANEAGIGAHQLQYETTNIFGCTNAVSQIVHVDAEKKVSFSYTADQRLVSFVATVENTQNVLWDFGNGESSNAISPSYYYNKDGIYTVILSSSDASNVCPEISFQDDVNVIGGSVDEKENLVEIYPNPFNDQLMVKTNALEINSLQIFSASGKLVFEAQNLAQNTIIDTQNFSSGIYLLKVSNSSQIFNRVIIK